MTGKRDAVPDHPVVAAALETGYGTQQPTGNRDTPECRREYVDEHGAELTDWLRREHPELLDQFIEAREAHYRGWLN